MGAAMSPISSRKSVPPSACSKRPRRWATAPENAPFSWPKSSLSTSSAGTAAQFIFTNGCSRRGERSWTARATSSLPVPFSPRIRMGTSAGAARSTRARRAAHLAALADEGQLVVPVLLQLAVLALQAVQPQRVAQGEEQALEADRLLDEVERAQARGLHRRVQGGLAAHQDDGHVGRALADAGQELEAVHLRHHHVGEDRVHRLFLQALEAARGRARGDRGVALQREGARERGQRARVVVDDQDSWLHVVASRHYAASGAPA